jgi:hypothetical protein
VLERKLLGDRTGRLGWGEAALKLTAETLSLVLHVHGNNGLIVVRDL